MYNWYAGHYNQIPVVQILHYNNKKRGHYCFPWKKYYSLWSGFDCCDESKMVFDREPLPYCSTHSGNNYY